MTASEVRAALRARHRDAILTVAARLRENARSADPLPFDVRRDIFRLVEAGLPQTAAHTLDTHLAAQGVTS